MVRCIAVRYIPNGNGYFTIPESSPGTAAVLQFAMGTHSASSVFETMDVWVGKDMKLEGLVDNTNGIDYITFLQSPEIIDSVSTAASDDPFPVGNFDPSTCSVVIGTDSSNALVAVSGGGSFVVSVWYDVLDLNNV